MVKSKTKISRQTQRKLNPELVETIKIAKKYKAWLKVAGFLSSSRRLKIAVNLDKINKEAGAGDIIVVPGKVLSIGDVDKKIKVAGFGFSAKAKEKLKKSGCEAVSILEEIKSNKEAKAVKILTNIRKWKS